MTSLAAQIYLAAQLGVTVSRFGLYEYTMVLSILVG